MNGHTKVTSYNNMISSMNILYEAGKTISEYIDQLEKNNDKKSLIKIDFSKIHNTY